MEESKFYRCVRPILPKALRPLVLRYQEIISYIVFGGLTTLVNLLIYFPLKMVIHYLAANVVAWVGSVLFAFFTNKAFVFQDSRWELRFLLPQAAAFAVARLLSLGLEEGMLILLVTGMGLPSGAIKILAQVVVVLVNYVASKWLVFRNQKTE
jgi:putative flippase GtrA